MRGFEEYHPLPQFLYFLAVSLLSTVFIHPVITGLSLLFALLFWFVRNGGRHARSHGIYAAMFAVMVLINPLFRHTGATVLFLINHNPITLESVLYGVFAAAMLISVLYWCRSLSQMMTTDRLLYLFSRLSPRLALIVSMALRYIPLFGRQAAKVHAMQRQLGALREDNLIDNTKAALRTVSVMTTWSLENGIITADSMAARGYGVSRRTVYHLFRMRRGDVFLLCATLLLTAAVTVLGVLGALEMSWYPYISAPRGDWMALAAYACYAALAALPTALEIGGMIRWNCLRSKI